MLKRIRSLSFEAKVTIILVILVAAYASWDNHKVANKARLDADSDTQKIKVEADAQKRSDLRGRLDVIAIVESKNPPHLNKQKHVHTFPPVTDDLDNTVKSGAAYFSDDKLHAGAWSQYPEATSISPQVMLNLLELERTVKAFEAVVGLIHDFAQKIFKLSEMERATRIEPASQGDRLSFHEEVLEAQKKCLACLKLKNEREISSCVSRALKGFRTQTAAVGLK